MQSKPMGASAAPHPSRDYDVEEETAWMYSALSAYLSVPGDSIERQVLGGEALCELVIQAWGGGTRALPVLGEPGTYEFSSAAARNIGAFTSACRARGMPESILFEYSEFKLGQPRARHACCQCVYEVLRSDPSASSLLLKRVCRPPKSLTTYSDLALSRYRARENGNDLGSRLLNVFRDWSRDPLLWILFRAACVLIVYRVLGKVLGVR